MPDFIFCEFVVGIFDQFVHVIGHMLFEVGLIIVMKVTADILDFFVGSLILALLLLNIPISVVLRVFLITLVLLNLRLKIRVLIFFLSPILLGTFGDFLRIIIRRLMGLRMSMLIIVEGVGFYTLIEGVGLTFAV